MPTVTKKNRKSSRNRRKPAHADRPRKRRFALPSNLARSLSPSMVSALGSLSRAWLPRPAGVHVNTLRALAKRGLVEHANGRWRSLV